MSTMPAPSLPLPIEVEMHVGGDWQSIPSDVLQRTDISIHHGLSDETTSVQPTSMSLLLKNPADDYDPANGSGQFFGTIGRNMPMRVSLVGDRDTFQRTVTNGWGTSDSGDVWIAAGAASAFAVTPGAATHAVSPGAAPRSKTTALWGDVDVSYTWTVLNATSVTGANVLTAALLRGLSDTVCYFVETIINAADQSISQRILDQGGNPFSDTIAAGIFHSFVSAQSLRIRAQIEGDTVRAKVWDASQPEPAGWLVVASVGDNSAATRLDDPGYVGILSDVDTGNTNAHPVTFTYSDVTIRAPRWAGYVFLQPTTDQSGLDKTVAVTGGSVLRQLSQGQLPVQSPLRHDIPSLPQLVAYWPCEDGTQATSLASAFPGGSDMAFNGTPQLASDTSFVGSAALPVVNGSYWFGNVGPYTNTGQVQVRALVKFPPAATLNDRTVILRFWTNGTADTRWDLYYTAGGGLGLTGTDSSGQFFDSGATGFNVDETNGRLSVELVQSGSNIAGKIAELRQGETTGGLVTFTVTGRTITTCHAVAVGPPGNDLKSTVVGHITVESAQTDLFDLAAQLNAFSGEDAVARLKRLCGYIGTEFGWTGDQWAKPLLMGPQPLSDLYQLIQLTAVSDGGLLYDAKGSPALMYRIGGAHSSPRTVVALDRAQHHLAEPPTPMWDDQVLRNDITVANSDGSTVEAALTTGAMSTALPPNGMGVYPTQVQVNLQSEASVQDMAQWLLHVGTVDKARYPQIAVNLTRPGNADLYWPLLDVAPDTGMTLAGQEPDVVSLLARGYAETLNAFAHQLVFACARGEPLAAPVLNITRLASASSTVATALVTTTATSFTVGTSSRIWTTNPGDFPFDIMVEGERMTVTAVAGATPPQTFTVVRSVNGVVKQHRIGAKVDLADPTYLALGR